MKFSRIFFLMAVTAIGFISCRKDEGMKNMAGTWVGRWGFGNNVPTYYEHWVLDKNGGLNAYDTNGNLYATGTWKGHGSDFEARYTPVGENYIYSFSGFYDQDVEEITGNWGEIPSTSNGGTFEMYRQ